MPATGGERISRPRARDGSFPGPISFLSAKKKRGRAPKEKTLIFSGAPAPFLSYPLQQVPLSHELPYIVRFFGDPGEAVRLRWGKEERGSNQSGFACKFRRLRTRRRRKPRRRSGAAIILQQTAVLPLFEGTDMSGGLSPLIKAPGVQRVATLWRFCPFWRQKG